jgi:hypothetical protein
VLLVAAAAAVVVAAGLASVALARGGSHATPSAVRSATVSFGGGRWVCQVAAFPGDPGRPTMLVVRLSEPRGESGSYTVAAVPADGTPPVAVGSITLVRGAGVLAAPVPPGTGKVHGIQVIEPNGDMRYRASFPAV